MSSVQKPEQQVGGVPNVMVVDPRFDAYVPLAAAAREGRLNLHLRSSGSDALRLARRLPVDVWLVGEDLDDMSGEDFVELLDGLDIGLPHARVALVAGSATSQLSAAGADAVLQQPISLADLTALLAVPAEQRAEILAVPGVKRGLVTLPVGIGAAVIAVAVLMMG